MKQLEALDVAGFIVTTGIKNDLVVTHIHIQKILFYLECSCLLHHESPLYEQDVFAWRLGPVYPDVHREYYQYGSRPVTNIPKIFRFDEDTMKLVHYNYKDSLLPSSFRKRSKPLILELLNMNYDDIITHSRKFHEYIFNQPTDNTPSKVLNKGNIMYELKNNDLLFASLFTNHLKLK